MPADANRDRAEILQHIDSIFQAYIRQDRDAIRRTHTADWTGFQGPSTKIERGIADYMVNAERSLAAFHGTGYELLDKEVQIYGDIALVYYVARFDYVDGDGRPGSLPLRSIDIYRRGKDGWNQAGSHITPIPSGGTWGATAPAHGPTPTPSSVTTPSHAASMPRTLSDSECAELLRTREAVWRAWFANDTAALRKLLPDDLIAIDAQTQEWSDLSNVTRNAEAFARDGGKLIRLEFPKTQIQVYGETAVLYTSYVMEIERNGDRTTASGRGTEVFVRRNGAWLNTGWHLDSGS